MSANNNTLRQKILELVEPSHETFQVTYRYVIRLETSEQLLHFRKARERDFILRTDTRVNLFARIIDPLLP